MTQVLGCLRARWRALRTRAIHERDYWTFRRRYGSILRPSPSTPGGTALLASLTYFTYQVKLEGVLAKAFQLQGLEPVAAVPRDGRFPRRYLELYGIRRFVALDDFVDARATEAHEEAQRMLDGVRTTEDLKLLRFRGASVGRQVLSTISRYLHEGRIDLAEPRAQELLRELLPAAIRSALAAEALLDEVGPDLVLFNERNYADQGPLSDLALGRGLNVIQFVAGFDDDSLVFKRYTEETKGLHPRSLSDDSWHRVASMRWTEQRERELADDFARRYDGSTFMARWTQAWTQPHSRDEIVRKLRLDPKKKIAVVFSHILWDANMFYGRDLFADQEEWFVETVRAACANPRVNWVIKLHPANVWKRRRDAVDGELDELVAMRERVGELPPHVALLRPEAEIATRSLFDAIDWAITIRGSVGFEAPCFGVPVLTAGTGFYSGRGFTIDSATGDEYLGRLGRIEEIPRLSDQAVELARKHAYALFRLRQTRFATFRSVFQPVEKLAHPFEATVELRARSAAELQGAPDLHRFGTWAVESRALDYLEDVPG